MAGGRAAPVRILCTGTHAYIYSKNMTIKGLSLCRAPSRTRAGVARNVPTSAPGTRPTSAETFQVLVCSTSVLLLKQVRTHSTASGTSLLIRL